MCSFRKPYKSHKASDAFNVLHQSLGQSMFNSKCDFCKDSQFFLEKSPPELSELFSMLLWTLWTTHFLQIHTSTSSTSNKALRFHSSLSLHKCFMHFKFPLLSPRATLTSLLLPFVSLPRLALYAKSDVSARQPDNQGTLLPVTKLVNPLLCVMT